VTVCKHETTWHKRYKDKWHISRHRYCILHGFCVKIFPNCLAQACAGLVICSVYTNHYYINTRALKIGDGHSNWTGTIIHSLIGAWSRYIAMFESGAHFEKCRSQVFVYFGAKRLLEFEYIVGVSECVHYVETWTGTTWYILRLATARSGWCLLRVLAKSVIIIYQHCIFSVIQPILPMPG
jgi:hypothetical protein